MSSLGKMFGSLTAPGFPLPSLPGGLGLPEKVSIGQNLIGGKNPKIDSAKKSDIDAQLTGDLAKANTYNKAFADLLNQQPQLDGSERSQLYDAYSVKRPNQLKSLIADPTDYSSTLSQLTPDQFRAQQQQQQQQQQQVAQAPAEAAPQQQATAAPAPVAAPAAPQTVGPVPVQPEATPTVATPGGNVAGVTKTNSATAPEKAGRRGRMATLLTGLGGAVERFGL